MKDLKRADESWEAYYARHGEELLLGRVMTADEILVDDARLAMLRADQPACPLCGRHKYQEPTGCSGEFHNVPNLIES